MAHTPGPKEVQARLLREAAYAQGQAKNNKKPSASELRKKIAAVKPKTHKGGARGR